jgi:hypothetical protein
MKIHIVVFTEHVTVRAAPEGPDGLIGDFYRELSPGDALWGVDYANLRAMGDGEHDFPPEPEKS